MDSARYSVRGGPFGTWNSWSGISRPKALDAYRALYRRGERTGDWFEVEEMPLTRTQTEERTIKFTLAMDGGRKKPWAHGPIVPLDLWPH